MEQTPDFTNPPIVEFVLGVQFAPLENIRRGIWGCSESILEEVDGLWLAMSHR